MIAACSSTSGWSRSGTEAIATRGTLLQSIVGNADHSCASVRTRYERRLAVKITPWKRRFNSRYSCRSLGVSHAAIRVASALSSSSSSSEMLAAAKRAAIPSMKDRQVYRSSTSATENSTTRTPR